MFYQSILLLIHQTGLLLLIDCERFRKNFIYFLVPFFTVYFLYTGTKLKHGQALIYSGTSNTTGTQLIEIRPRVTLHGGKTKTVS